VPTGHALDLRLRRGERFTQWWKPQGDRWQMLDAEGKDAKRRTVLEAAPRGPKAADKSTKPLFANGQFVYEPSLKDDPGDFRDGVYDSANVEITSDGLTLAKAGDGFAIFEVRSPYIIVADLGKLEDPKDDHDASVVELDAAEASVTVSKDYGATWLSLETKAFPAKLDLTPQVAGTYGYLLRIDLKGQPGKAVLKALKVTTWVQVAPGLLPAVRTGNNAFTLKTGDADGRPTLPFVIDASTADENGFLRPVIRPPQEFNPGHASRRVVGPFTARIAALPQTRIVAFHVGGSFACDPQNVADAEAKIGYALQRPAGFQPLDLPKLPADQSYEHYHIDIPVTLNEPASAVYVQCEGKPALNQLCLSARCVRNAPPRPSPLRIIHRWTEGGTAREHSVELVDQGHYEFDAGNDGVNDSIEMRVASGRE